MWFHGQSCVRWSSRTTPRGSFTKRCPSYGKSVRRERVEGEFETLLDGLAPTENLFQIARMMFEELWNHQLGSQKALGQSLETEIAKIDRKIVQLLDRIVDTDSRDLVSAYENRIRELEGQKAEMTEKIASCGRPLKSFDEGFRTAMDFLAKPRNLWNSECLEDKRAVLKLAFAERLAYARNEGFRTAHMAFPFKLLDTISKSKNEMASPRGFEPLSPP